jgi:hypothetical protein
MKVRLIETIEQQSDRRRRFCNRSTLVAEDSRVNSAGESRRCGEARIGTDPCGRQDGVS